MTIATQLDDLGNVLTLTANGTYSMVVDGNGGEGTGAYQFQLLDLDNAPVVGLDTDIVGQLNTTTSSKVYRFTLESDRYIYFDAQAGSSPNTWLLYGGNGENSNANNAVPIGTDYEAQLSAGNYFLVMRGEGAVDRTFKMRLVTPEFIANPIALNTVVSGNIGEAGEQDTYTFSGTAGQWLHLDLLNRGTTNTTVKVYNQSGTEIYNRNLSTLDTNSLMILKETGSYRLVVDGVNVTAEAYSFRLLDAKAAATIGLDADVTGQLTLGQETQFYQFTGTQGQRLYLDWLNTTPNTTFWTLYDEAGNIVDDRISGDYETTLANSGRYTIGVRGYNNGAINYGFRLITPETYTSEIDLVGNAGGVIEGAINEKGELNVYTFTAAAGQQLLMDKHLFPTGLNLRIYASTGTDVTPLNGVGDILTITQSGTYRAIVSGTSGATGSYGFRLLDNSRFAEKKQKNVK